MILQLAGLAVLIVIQTIFLLAAFWIMIKLQKLEYSFPGLLGSAAFVGILDEVLHFFLEPHLGIYLTSSITTPIVVIASLVCISKVTQAELVDVFFTVAVGRALWFGMNLWLIGGLMGDLRPASPVDNDNEPPPVTEQRREITEGKPMQVWTNRTVAPRAPAASVPATNSPRLGATQPGQTTPPAEIARHISVKGVTRNGAKSSVTIQYGSRSYVLFYDDPIMVLTDNGPATVRLKTLDAESMLLLINGVEVKQRITQY